MGTYTKWWSTTGVLGTFALKKSTCPDVTHCYTMHLSGKCPSQKWSNKSSECAAQESWWCSCKVPIWCMYPVVYFVWCIYRTSMLFDVVYPHRIAISIKPRTNILVVPRFCHRICRLWMIPLIPCVQELGGNCSQPNGSSSWVWGSGRNLSCTPQ